MIEGKNENMKEDVLIDEIRRMMRLGKLDSLLLFASSFSGLIFSLLQVVLGGLNAIIYFLPFLVSITFMSIYIGYIRGGITIDKIEERVRGWVYLIVGSIAYSFYLFIINLYRLSNEVEKHSKVLITILMVLILVFLLFPSYKVSKYMLEFFYKYTGLGEPISKVTKGTISATLWASWNLDTTFVIIAYTLYVMVNDGFDLPLITFHVVLAGLCFFFFYFFERRARYLVSTL